MSKGDRLVIQKGIQGNRKFSFVLLSSSTTYTILLRDDSSVPPQSLFNSPDQFSLFVRSNDVCPYFIKINKFTCDLSPWGQFRVIILQQTMTNKYFHKRGWGGGQPGQSPTYLSTYLLSPPPLFNVTCYYFLLFYSISQLVTRYLVFSVR